MTSPWLVVGASPSSSEYLGVALARRPLAKTITTNASIRLFDKHRLDYYFLSDHVACGKHAGEARQMQAQGTKLITLKRVDDALRRRGVETADLKLQATGPGGHAELVRGQYYHAGSLSGNWITQFAINNGADEIHWIGMEGYASTEAKVVPDHWDGAPGPPRGQFVNERCAQPFLQSCLDKCPDIHFVFYGRPQFRLAGDNLETVDDVAHTHS